MGTLGLCRTWAVCLCCAGHQDRILALVMADSWGSFDWPEQWDRAKMFAIPEGRSGP